MAHSCSARNVITVSNGSETATSGDSSEAAAGPVGVDPFEER